MDALTNRFHPVRTGPQHSGPVEGLRRRVDLDDMFGLRRALAVLPERLHDAFVQRWVQLGGRCDYDVRALSVETRNESDHWRRREPALASAWATVAVAMSRYVAWRSHAPGAPATAG
jgi:hypothetical protein